MWQMLFEENVINSWAGFSILGGKPSAIFLQNCEDIALLSY